MLKLKLQYFGHLIRRVDSLEKTLMLGGIGGRRRRGRQRMRWLDGITDMMDVSLSELREGVGDGQGGLVCCDSWVHKESNTTERLNWSRCSPRAQLWRWSLGSAKWKQLPCGIHWNWFQFSQSVVSNSATPWTEAHQASLSITDSQSLLKLVSIESVMPFNHLILCCPLLLLPSIFPSIRVF